MATREELETALRNADAAGDADAARALATEITRLSAGDKPTVAVDVAKSLGVGAGEGAIGLAGMPADFRSLIASGAKWGFDKLGLDKASGALDALRGIGGEGATSKNIKEKLVEPVTGEFYKPQTTEGKYARSVGQFLPSVAIPIGGVGSRVAGAVGGGLGSEAMGQAYEGTAAEPYMRAVGGVAGGLAPNLLSRAVTPNPSSAERQRLVEILRNEGVTSTTAGQRTGSNSLRFQESALGDAPMAGGGAQAVDRLGKEQFTAAALRRAGSNGPLATPEVMAQNHDRLQAEFRRLSANNTLRPDNQFVADVTNAVRTYQRVPPSQQRAIVEGYLDDITGHVRTGAMPGTHYQEMRSRLSRQANNLRDSDPTLSEALRDLRNSLDDAMGRSIPQAEQEAWQTARRQYGNNKVLEQAASRAGEQTGEGIIVPSNLRNAVATRDKGAYTRGEGDFSELARAGATVMQPMPQSGTAPRSMLYNISNVGTAGALPALMGRALMSAPVQGYLGNQLIQQQQGAREALIRALLQGSSPAARLQYQPQAQ